MPDIIRMTACLYVFLQEQSSSVGEYELIQLLNEAGLFDPLVKMSSSLLLFNKHFLTMHCLYSLQEECSQNNQILIVSPLEIQILKSKSLAQNQHLGFAHHKISQYYLDLNNLKEATEDTVEELLQSFWKKFTAWQSGGSAFEALGLTEKASWAEVQQAYRKKAQLEHPDKGGTAETFSEVREAYQILKKRFEVKK